MNRVLHGLILEDGPDFVGVYLDDNVIFSTTLDEHLKNLRAMLGTI